MSLIVLLTDFGQGDGFVGTMKGVIAGIAPGVPVVDLSHDIPPQNVATAGFILWNSYRYFPEETIFVCVVDPGVGSSRRILAVRTDRHYLIAPENGLLDCVLAEVEVQKVREVKNPRLFQSDISQTFHGRDIFSPVAAHLAVGVPFSHVGPPLAFQLPPSPFAAITAGKTASARIIHIDHFGNLITHLRFPAGTGGRVVWQGGSIPVRSAYADVAPGEALALSASHGLLEVAVRNGHAARSLQASYGDVLTWVAD